jgi:acyl-lipid omega-6 desaturase (Delta-12 desaturase)
MFPRSPRLSNSLSDTDRSAMSYVGNAPVPPYSAGAKPVDRSAVDRRSLGKGLFLFAEHTVLYVATLAGALAPLPIAANILLAIANGFFIGQLFIVGHDGAHGSLVPSRRLNLWIARLAFIPSVHAVSLWHVIHHKHHHRYTNLKGADGVWEPMSKKEYDSAHPARRWLERVCRGPWGPLIYYYVSFWPHRVLLPLAPEVRERWRHHLPDSMFALTGLFLTLFCVATVGAMLSPGRGPWLAVLVGWALPFAVWNYLMAVTTYLNHTHPAIAWFDDEARWSHYRGNVLGTAHVKFPINVIPLYTKFHAHTAHHVRPRTPVYVLPDAQAELKSGNGNLVEYALTLGAYKKIYRACKLFDFENMCWTDFRGVPSA